jgi:hypothetical protein
VSTTSPSASSCQCCQSLECLPAPVTSLDSRDSDSINRNMCPRFLLRPLECLLAATVPLCISLRAWQTWSPRVVVLLIVTLISLISYRNLLSPQVCPSLTTTCAAVAWSGAVLILMLLICFCAAFAKGPGLVPRILGYVRGTTHRHLPDHMWTLLCVSFSVNGTRRPDYDGTSLEICSKCIPPRLKPEGSHHCRVCKRCVLAMDHHW